MEVLEHSIWLLHMHNYMYLFLPSAVYLAAATLPPGSNGGLPCGPSSCLPCGPSSCCFQRVQQLHSTVSGLANSSI